MTEFIQSDKEKIESSKLFEVLFLSAGTFIVVSIMHLRNVKHVNLRKVVFTNDNVDTFKFEQKHVM